MFKKSERSVFGGRLSLFCLIASVGFFADLATKRLMFDRLGLPGAREVDWVIPNIFGFQTSLNEGALFGMGQGMTWFFVAASILAFAAILFWFVREAFASRLLTVSLGLVMAGIGGNLWDRLALHGLRWPSDFPSELADRPIQAVRDWILVLIGSYHWPNFNFADCFLVVGTIFICVYALFFYPHGANEDSQLSSPPEPEA